MLLGYPNPYPFLCQDLYGKKGNTLQVLQQAKIDTTPITVGHNTVPLARIVALINLRMTEKLK